MWVHPDAASRVAAAPAALDTLCTLGHAATTQGNVLRVVHALCTGGHISALHRAGARVLRVDLVTLCAGLVQLPLHAVQSATNPHRLAALSCLAALGRFPSALPPLELLFPLLAIAVEPPGPACSLHAACAHAAAAYSLVAALVERAVPVPGDGAPGCCQALAGHAVQWLQHAGLQQGLQDALQQGLQPALPLLDAVAAVAGFLLGRLCHSECVHTACHCTEFASGWLMAHPMRSRVHRLASEWITLLQPWVAPPGTGPAWEATTASCYALAAVVQLQAQTAAEAERQGGQAVAGRVLQACAAVRTGAMTTSLQPWQRPLLHMHAAMLTLAAAASEAALGELVDPPGTSARTACPLASSCLRVLEMAPPGTEPLALRVLSTLTRLDVLRGVREAAQSACGGLQDGASALGTVVAWGSRSAGQVCLWAARSALVCCL